MSSSGDSLTYIITVTNNGPSDVFGATINDIFSIDLENISYTSTATGGANGNSASGTGDISDIVNMPNGAQIVYTVTASVVEFTDDDEIRNTATVDAPDSITDSDLTNNSADTDTDTVRAVDNLMASPKWVRLILDMDRDGNFVDAGDSPLENVPKSSCRKMTTRWRRLKPPPMARTNSIIWWTLVSIWCEKSNPPWIRGRARYGWRFWGR